VKKLVKNVSFFGVICVMSENRHLITSHGVLPLIATAEADPVQTRTVLMIFSNASRFHPDATKDFIVDVLLLSSIRPFVSYLKIARKITVNKNSANGATHAEGQTP
jgi:hypothetical protein